jgi:hypothetical protein
VAEREKLFACKLQHFLLLCVELLSREPFRFLLFGYYLLLFADFFLTSQEREPRKRKQKKKNYQGE